MSHDPVVDKCGNRKCSKCGCVYGRKCQTCCGHANIALENDHYAGIEMICQDCLLQFSLDEFNQLFEIRRLTRKRDATPPR